MSKVTFAELAMAVGTIQQHLKNEWITECFEEGRSFGCVSCQAARLSEDLDALLSLESVEALSKEGGEE